MTAEDLNKSTVALCADGALLGTAFFIGPGLAVTCVHVVSEREHLDAMYERESYAARVIDRRSEQTIDDTLFPDLALIEIPGLALPGVELEEGFRETDPLYSWGFPSDSRWGDSISGVCERDRRFGPLEGQRLIKFKDTQVTPGLSGSPVLNLRTKKVCGMLKRTRDERSPMGGYAVRAAVLLDQPAIDAVQRSLDTELKRQLRAYLAEIIASASTLPGYFPARMNLFDGIRQRCRMVHDQTRFIQTADVLERERWRGRLLETGDQNLKNFSVGGKTITPDDSPHWDEVRGRKDMHSVVILGDAGLGKTWLITSEARRQAQIALDQLETHRSREIIAPVLARVPDLAFQVAKTETLAETFQLVWKARGYPDELREFLDAQLAAGQAAVFLDAWDEIADERERAILRSQIGVWGRQWLGCFVLTSRPANLGKSPMSNAPMLELVPFHRDDIAAFAKSWFGEAGAARFLEALKDDPSLAGLAQIPLMLSLLCRVFDEPGRVLPRERADLFEVCLYGLLKNWKREINFGATDDLRIRRMLSVLGHAAAALFPKSQFTALQFADAADLSDEEGLSVLTNALTDGVLTTVGTDPDSRLLFLHRTFQEYLAARQWAQDPSDYQLIEIRSTQPAWRGVIALFAGMLQKAGRAEAESIVKSFADPRRDDLFRSRLVLAIECVSEFPPEGRGEQFVRLLAAESVKCFRDHFAHGTERALVHLSRVMPALSRMSAFVKGNRLIEWLLTIEDSEQNAPRFEELAFNFGAAAAVPAVIERLEQKYPLHMPEAGFLDFGISISDTRYSPGQIIRRFGRETSGIAPAEWFVDLLRDDRWLFLGAEVLQYYHETEIAQKVRLRLIEAVTLKIIPHVRARAARALSFLGPVPESVLHHLLEISRDDDFLVCGSAMEALGWLTPNPPSERVLTRVTECLRHESYWPHNAALETVQRLGESAATEHVIDALLDNTYDRKWQARAAEAIGELGPAAATPRVLQRLIALLREGDLMTAENAAQAIGRLERGTDSCAELQEIIDMTRSGDAESRMRTITILGHIGRWTGATEVLARLTELLGSHDKKTAEAVSDSLMALGSVAAIPVVLDWLLVHLKDRDSDMLLTAIEVVNALGEPAMTDQILKRLLELSYDSDWEVLEYVAAAFGSAGRAATEEVIARLVGMTHEEDSSYVRRTAISSLRWMQLSMPDIPISKPSWWDKRR